MSARTSGTGRDEWVDEKALQLCNLCIRRSRLEKFPKPFHEGLVSAEENLLLHTLHREGVRQLHSPDIFVYHRRRDSLFGFLRQMFLSAAGRFQMVRLLPCSFLPPFGIPTLFLFYILSLPFWRSPSAFYPLGLYLLCLAFESLRSLKVIGNLRASLWTLVLFPCCHLAYGLGFALGGFLWRSAE